MRNITKTEIWVNYGYGGHTITFKKEFELPFTPFYDMEILDKVDYHENILILRNTDFQTTSILYDTEKDAFNIDIRNIWRRPIGDDTIDGILKIFKNTRWERVDRTDIDKFRELMARTNKLGLY